MPEQTIKYKLIDHKIIKCIVYQGLLLLPLRSNEQTEHFM